MLTKRLEIVVSPEMKKVLKREAKLRKITVGAVVRECIKKSLEIISQSKKGIK